MFLLLSFQAPGEDAVDQDLQRVGFDKDPVCLPEDSCWFGKPKWNKGTTERSWPKKEGQEVGR